MLRAFVIVMACASLGPALALAQAPAVSQRAWLSGDVTNGAATGDQSTARIARGGDGLLVAWSDRRASLASAGPESGADVFAMRLDANGQRLDAAPIALGLAFGDDTSPRVAWNGANWLVTWASQAPFASQYATAIVGRRVSPAGVALEPAPFFVLGEPNTLVASHALDSDGSQWVAITGGSTSGMSGVLAARISAQGVVLDPTPVQLMPPSSFGGNYALAYAQGVHLVAWTDWNGDNADDVFARRFDANLQALDASRFVVASTFVSEGAPDVASNGAEFLVAWPRVNSGILLGDARAARVSTAGVVLDPGSIVASGNMPYLTSPVRAAWDGTQWFLSWKYFGIELSRISAGGVALDPAGFPFSPVGVTDQFDAVLAGSPQGGVQMVWTDERAGSYEGLDLYTARVTGPTGLGSESVVSIGAPAQASADLAGDATQRAVVFRSETSGARRILVSRLDANGAALDAQPIEIASGLQSYAPSIAFDGQVYLVVWNGASGSGPADTIYLRRMAIDGTLLDPAPVALGVGTDPEVAGQGGQFLVVWTRAVAFPVQQFPNVALVRGSDGAVLAGPTVINSNYAIAPDVCAIGGRWLVAWQRNYWNNDTHCDANAVFVEGNGVVGTPIFVHGPFNNYQSHVRVAAGDGQALIAWTTGTASNLTRRVVAKRILPDGTLLDANPIALQPGVAGEQFHPELAWDGARYVVAFQDLRGSTSLLDKVSDVLAVRVRPDGTLDEPSGFALEAGPGSAVAPAMFGLGAGRSLAAVSVFRAEAPYSAYRLALRTIDGNVAAPLAYCFGDGSGAACPCGNAGLAGHGCANSVNPSGASLAGFGQASLASDSLVLAGAGMTNGSVLYFQGTSRQNGGAGVAFGDGLRCVGGTIVRLWTVVNAGGASQVPAPGDPGIAVRGQVGSPGTRTYQAWYRNAAPGFCTAATYNLTNGVEVLWAP
ncbi:MAG: hypothetical protein JNK02_17280 [Planctomycetes bacterium]|nr:hypothetical protein [Planctomycetota bacterium]